MLILYAIRKNTPGNGIGVSFFNAALSVYFRDTVQHFNFHVRARIFFSKIGIYPLPNKSNWLCLTKQMVAWLNYLFAYLSVYIIMIFVSRASLISHGIGWTP